MWSRTFFSSLALFSMAATQVAAGGNWEYSPVSESELNELLGKPVKRAAFDESLATDLKPQKSLFWAMADGDRLAYANLTASMPEDTQYMLDTDDFKPMIERMVCGENINLEFKTARQMEVARRKWDWVNEDDGRQLAMLANWRGCGVNGRRNVFQIQSIKWDLPNKTAHIKSNRKKLSQVLHSYHLELDHAPLRQTNVRVRAEFSKSYDLSSSFTQDLFNHTLGGYYIAAACTDCGTSGSFNLKGVIDVGLFEINEAYISMEAQDMGAWLGVWGSVGLGSVPGAGFSWRKTVFKYPLYPGNPIPEILEIGPYGAVDVGFKLGKVSGGMQMAAGARVDIPDGSYAKMDFSDVDNVQGSSEGWEPEVSTTPVSLDGYVTLHNEVYAILALQWRFGIDLGVTDYVWVASLDLKLPYFGADITAAHNQDNDVCNGEGDQSSSVSVVGNIGTQLKFQVSKDDDMADPLVQIPLYETHWPIYSTCFAFGGESDHPFQNISSIPEPTYTAPANDSAKIKARATPAAEARGYYKGKPVQW
jgi:hypothetical protein